MFHQIYELMVLGMHPAISSSRRSQIRPQGETAARARHYEAREFHCMAGRAACSPSVPVTIDPVAAGRLRAVWDPGQTTFASTIYGLALL